VAANVSPSDGSYRSPAIEAQQQRQQIEQLRQSEPNQPGTMPAAVAVTVQPAATAPSDPPASTVQEASPPPAVVVSPAQQPAVVAASPTQQPAVQAGSPQIPPGSPPVALDGFCPVTLVEKRAWSAGNVAFGAVHRGRTYLFVGPEQVQKFLANPDAYAPVLSGNDPVLALDNQVSVPGRREYGVFSGSRIYLFANEESRNRFQQNPNRYAAEAVQAMR
jgi:YHS domain-containing protein